MGLDLPVAEWAAEEGIANEEIHERLTKHADETMARKVAQVGPELLRQVEKSVLLQTIDMRWREHLQQLDQLRQFVGLRGYGQRDPLNEYKTESFELFENLLHRLREDVTRQLMHIEFVQENTPALQQPEMHPSHIDPLTGRNEMADEASDPLSGLEPLRNRTAVDADPENPETWGRVARNAPCPCGSGKKYKHCHGAI